MITISYDLKHPNCQPKSASARSPVWLASAYLEGKPAVSCADIPFDAYPRTYINGIERTISSNRDLQLIEIGRRFVSIQPGEIVTIDLGFKIDLSSDRLSKLATAMLCSIPSCARQGLAVVNAPGIIKEDCDRYISVSLINHSADLHLIGHGAAIAQLIFIETEVPQVFVNSIKQQQKVGAVT